LIISQDVTFNETIKKGLSVGAMSMFARTQEEQKVFINMFEDDEEVGDEELISHKATTTPFNIMVQPKSQL